jgi:hypothetical protein
VHFDVAHFAFGCHWQKGQCTEAIFYDLVSYDLHRNTSIKAAVVVIVQNATNLRCSGGSGAALGTVGTTIQFVIRARK